MNARRRPGRPHYSPRWLRYLARLSAERGTSPRDELAKAKASA